MKIVHLFVFLVLVYSSSGSSPSEGNPYRDLLVDWEKTATPYSIASQQARDDLRTLAKILYGGYAGLEIRREEGFDWKSHFGRLDETVAGQDRWRPSQLAELLVAELSGLDDRHFGFFVEEGGNRKWFPATPERGVFFADILFTAAKGGLFLVTGTGSGKSESLLGTVLDKVNGEPPKKWLYPTSPDQEGQKRFLVGRMKETQPAPLVLTLKNRQGQAVEVALPLHRCRVRLQRTSGRAFRLTRVPFPRIELGSFEASRSDELEPFLQTAEDLSEEPLVVVDLRGNPGGRDSYGKAWLERLTGGNPESWKVRELVSPVTLQGDVNLHEWLLRGVSQTAAKQEIGGRLAHFRKRLEEAEKESLKRTWTNPAASLSAETSEPDRHSERSGEWRGRLVVLVDGGTRSSAETFVLLAEQIPGTVVVGENTGGMMRFGEVKLYRLPHSGIWVQAGSKVFEDPSGGYREAVGFLPDYWLDDSHPISSISRWLGGGETLSGVAD